MRLCAVVVTFNRRAQIETTVRRLLAEELDHLVVVDNGSTDGTRDWLAGIDDPRLVTLLPDRNLGGAGGFETGMRHAVRRFDPDWMVVMDDDARPAPGALAAFRRAPLAGWDAVAAAVRYPDGRICGMNRPVLNPFWHPGIFLRTLLGGGRAAFHLGDRDFAASAPRQVDGASFVGLFLSRAGLARADYPDGDLFIYAEDGLYTLRLSRRGGRIGFLPQIGFEHDCSTLTPSGRFTPIWKAYYYHRNLLFLYRMAAGWLFWPALVLVLPKWLAKARHQGEEAGTYRRLLWRAVRDGLAGRRRRLGEDEGGPA
jgi:GT2 family glycosyltransferase